MDEETEAYKVVTCLRLHKREMQGQDSGPDTETESLCS